MEHVYINRVVLDKNVKREELVHEIINLFLTREKEHLHVKCCLEMIDELRERLNDKDLLISELREEVKYLKNQKRFTTKRFK